MKKLLFTMKTSFVILVWISGLVRAEQKINGVTEIDLVLNGINKESWNQDELPCYKQTVFLLENAKNYTVWAMLIWNSMQRPVGTFYGTLYSLGSYDQCIKNIHNENDTVITTQYCLADVKLTRKQFEANNRNIMSSSESYLGVRSKRNRDLSKITWGTCLPASCKPDSMAKMLKIIYLVNPITPDEPSITINHCQVAGEERKFTVGLYIFVALVIGLITAVLLSIFYAPNADVNSIVTRVLDCFNLKRNFVSLAKDLSADDIPTLNLTKVVLSVSVVAVHYYYFILIGSVSNIISTDEYVPTFEKIVHVFLRDIDLAVDIYLVMSAIFFMKGLMKKRRHPLISLLNRYFRLIGTYALVTFYTVTVSMHTGDGPLWSKLAGREQSASSANWHWSLLLLNNYIGSENFSMLVSWYIHCDYQLTIMGTIIFMLWQKDKRLAKLVSILTFILSILTPAVVTYWKRLPGKLIDGDIVKIIDVRKNEVFLETYMQSQHRAAPYLLGLALGYFMTVYKPSKSRKIFSMVGMPAVDVVAKIRREQSLFIPVATSGRLPSALKMSVILFVAVCLCGSHLMDAAVSWCGDDTVLSTAVYIGCNRLVFALNVCSCILLVEYGKFTFLEKIAEHQLITIMSRLAYGIYMTHSAIIQQNTFSTRNSAHLTLLSLITCSMGVWCLCIPVSILLWFLVEAPISNIFNLITNSRQKRKIENEFNEEKRLDKEM